MSLSENMTLSSNKLVAAPTSSETSSMDSMFSGMGLGDYVNSDKRKITISTKEHYRKLYPEGLK